MPLLENKGSAKAFLVWLVGIVLLLDLLVVAVALVSLQQSRRQYQERAAVQSQNLAQALVSSMAGIIDTADVAIEAVIDEAEDGLARGGIDPADLNKDIARLNKKIPGLDSIRMVDASGTIVYGMGLGSSRRKSVADRDYFKRLRDDPHAGLVISEPVFGRVSGKWVIVVARRVNKPDGSFAGLVYAPITLERVLDTFSLIDVGAHGGISLRDGQMKIIVRHPARQTDGDASARQIISEQLLRQLESGRRHATFYTPRSFDGLAKTISFQKIRQHPLFIVVALAATDYLAPWQGDLYRMAALVLLFVLVTLVLSRLVYLRWRREKVAEEELRRSKRELELRVAERTEELCQANARLVSELAERQMAEERVLEGRNTLAQIIDAIPQTVFWKDRESVYLGCNVVFARRAGMASADGVVGKTDYDLPWLREESDAYRADDREVMDGNLPKCHIIEQQLQANGSRVWVDTTKVPLCDHDGQVYGVLGVYDDITARKEIEESRDKALILFESLLTSSPTGIQVFDAETGDCVTANQAFAEIVGGDVPAMLNQNFRRLSSWQATGITTLAEQVLSDSATRHIVSEITTTFGKEVYLELILCRCDVESRPHLMTIALDKTETWRLEQENKRIEAQMLHVQKLESLGVLAGGIAHDFNNILMAVIGNADLAMMRLESDSPARHNLVQIEHAATRAADLARQMLAYSGQGRFVIEDLDVNAIIDEMGQMLEVSVSKKVWLSYQLSSELPAVTGDGTQLRQVLLNLVMNASEAIEERNGIVTIRTGAMNCDQQYLAESWVDDQLPAGRYVFIEVEDNGCGMDDDVLARIFDPFFTTKFTGRGLGMAAVLGIVRGHKGAIKVASTKGVGTTFTLLFPAAEVTADEPQAVHEVEKLHSGAGTVLLVDDEEVIRKLGEHMLHAQGYDVLTASDGRRAIEMFMKHRHEIIGVVLDLTMPVLDGEQTLKELRLIDPDIRAIIASGYHEHEVSRKFIGHDNIAFIQKPYRLAEMCKKFKEVLG